MELRVDLIRRSGIVIQLEDNHGEQHCLLYHRNKCSVEKEPLVSKVMMSNPITALQHIIQREEGQACVLVVRDTTINFGTKPYSVFARLLTCSSAYAARPSLNISTEPNTDPFINSVQQTLIILSTRHSLLHPLRAGLVIAHQVAAASQQPNSHRDRLSRTTFNVKSRIKEPQLLHQHDMKSS